MYKFIIIVGLIISPFSGKIFSDDKIPIKKSQSQIDEINELKNKIHRLFSQLNKDRHIPVITAKRLKRTIKDPNIILVDVRNSDEMEVSILPNAISRREFEKKYANQNLSAKKVIVYCTVGERSGRYVETMNKQFPNMYNLIGGILAWSLVNGEFYKKEKNGENIPTKDAHTHSREWNYLNPTYNAVY